MYIKILGTFFAVFKRLPKNFTHLVSKFHSPVTSNLSNSQPLLITLKSYFKLVVCPDLINLCIHEFTAV